jgi:hypothetical protein
VLLCHELIQILRTLKRQQLDPSPAVKPDTPGRLLEQMTPLVRQYYQRCIGSQAEGEELKDAIVAASQLWMSDEEVETITGYNFPKTSTGVPPTRFSISEAAYIMKRQHIRGETSGSNGNSVRVFATVPVSYDETAEKMVPLDPGADLGESYYDTPVGDFLQGSPWQATRRLFGFPRDLDTAQ